MTEIEELKKEIEKIKERNKKVERDKTWETSWSRRIFIAVSTYILILIFLLTIHADRPYLSAIIPAVAYLISTASLDIVKQYWLKKKKG
ncbi:MAG: hypothetical protein Q7K55_06310 [Candidatus Levybacteria bacterium]|nr:hypothetical protein [Candidatus Levybacteria bacterium]